MWKLLNIIFGWDYIAWSNNVANGIARVYKEEGCCGAVFYFRYRITSVVDKITDPNDVIWLTCASSKYFKEVSSE